MGDRSLSSDRGPIWTQGGAWTLRLPQADRHPPPRDQPEVLATIFSFSLSGLTGMLTWYTCVL